METLKEIYLLLTDKLSAVHVQLEDDSALHSGHAQAAHSSGGHYSAVVVSARFEGKAQLERHRLVYDALKDAMRQNIHALQLRTYTPDEWNKVNKGR